MKTQLIVALALLSAASAHSASFEAPASVAGVAVADKPGWTDPKRPTGLFLSADYACQDGDAGNVSTPKRCSSLSELHALVKSACANKCRKIVTSTGKPAVKCGVASFAARESCQ